MKTGKLVLLASLAVFAPQSASGEEAKGMLELRLSEPTLYETESHKRIVDLEYCVANAISASAGIPRGTYHDGPNRLIIFGNRIAEYKVFLVVALEEREDRTRIEVRGRSAGALVGFRDALERCI